MIFRAKWRAFFSAMWRDDEGEIESACILCHYLKSASIAWVDGPLLRFSPTTVLKTIRNVLPALAFLGSYGGDVYAGRDQIILLVPRRCKNSEKRRPFVKHIELLRQMILEKGAA